MKWIDKVKKMRACTEAVEWGDQFATIEEAWQKCEHGDWMLWLLGKLSGGPETDSRKKLVLCACQCARLALHYVKPGEQRPLKAIETAEAWAGGDDVITPEMLRAAASAAHAAFAAYAAAPAADAAHAAYAAASAAYAAADAADAAHAAHAAAYADAAKMETLKKCADIVREYYTEAPEI